MTLTTSLLLACLKIFFGRICDVSMGTIRNILTIKEKTLQSSMLAFCEAFLWYIIVKDALSGNGPVVPYAIAYAGGFAAGTFIGGKIAKKFVGGHVVVRIVTSSRSPELPQALRDAGYGITVMNVLGSEYAPEKYMIIVDVDKSKLKEFERKVLERDPGAFVLIEETKNYIGGFRPARK